MSFDHALYYPWIDIQNSEWLKTAILYWDKISTIVPEGMEFPYQNAETYILQDEKILEPYVVNSGSPVVHTAGINLSKYLNTIEARRVLTKPLNSNKFGLDNQWVKRIYAEKISTEGKERLLSLPLVYDRGDYLEMDNHTANYYMDLLAVEISQKEKWGLLTDSPTNETLTNKVKRGDSSSVIQKYLKSLGQCLLVKTVFSAFKISDNTPIETILTFRIDHSEELNNFRRGISDFSRMIDPDVANMAELEAEVNRIYQEHIKTAIRDLQNGLCKENIGFSVGSLATIGLTLGEVFANPTQNNVVNIIRSGYEIVSSYVSFRRSKSEKLRSSPWSYILSLRKLI